MVTVIKVYTEHSAFCSSVKTDMGAAGAVSRLYIANANKKDSGNYSCALANVAAVTMVSVHVLNGMFLRTYTFVSRYVIINMRAKNGGNIYFPEKLFFERKKIGKYYLFKFYVQSNRKNK